MNLLIQFIPGVDAKRRQINNIKIAVLYLADGTVGGALPAVTTIHLIQSHNEGRASLLEHIQRLNGLRLQSVHEIDHQDGDIAETAASAAEVGERLVTRGVDHQQAGKVDVERGGLLHHLEVVKRKKSKW